MTDTTTEAITQPAPLKGASWFITVLGIGQICSWGTLYYAFPQLAAAMEADLGWSKTALYGAATLGLLLSAFVAVPVGIAIDRGHGRWVMSGASVLAGILLALWGTIDNIVVYYLLLAGIGALQAATLYEAVFAVIARRAGPTHARDGITALTLWSGFGSTVFIPLTQMLLDQFDWRVTLEVLGAVNILIAATLYIAVIDPKKDRYRPSTHKASTGHPLRAAIKLPVFWGLAAAFTLFAATFSSVTLHFYPMMLERGFPAGDVVLAMAVMGPSQVGGRFVVSVLAPRMTARMLGSVIVACFPVALLILIAAPPLLWVICVAALIYGAGTGIMTIVRGIAIPEMISRENYGAIAGALSVPMVAARALAPLGAAWLWSMGNGYGAVLVAILVITVLMTAAFWWSAWVSRPTAA